jgi:hypothetical protein
MNKRSPFNYVALIERVQKWISANPGVHVNEMLETFSDTPRGTLSALLSYMMKTGHVIRGGKGFYALPEVVANPRSVAYDIKKSKETPNLFSKSFRKAERVKDETSKAPESNEQKPKGIAQIIRERSETPKIENNEDYAKSALAKFNRNQHVMDSIDLLKSYGYKVTIEF